MEVGCSIILLVETVKGHCQSLHFAGRALCDSKFMAGAASKKCRVVLFADVKLQNNWEIVVNQRVGHECPIFWEPGICLPIAMDILKQRGTKGQLALSDAFVGDFLAKLCEHAAGPKQPDCDLPTGKLHVHSSAMF
jgi:hypothetical protein